MSYIKNSKEVAHIRAACRMTSEIMDKLLEQAVPGVKTEEIDKLANKLTKERGAVPSFTGYLDYPASTCISVNDQVVHGLPGKYELKEGDVVGIDFGVNYRGHFSDMARTVAVGVISLDGQRLVKETKVALDKGIAEMKPNKNVGDIGAAIQRHADKHKLGIVRELVGHGVGTAVHEPPPVPNYGRPGAGPQLVPGMILAIEPMFNLGGDGVKLFDDGWTYKTIDGSISAHFEDTVLVTEQGHEVLTRI